MSLISELLEVLGFLRREGHPSRGAALSAALAAAAARRMSPPFRSSPWPLRAPGAPEAGEFPSDKV